MINNLRIVFMGTSVYAEPVLRSLYENNYDIALVITQPDKRKGRNRRKASPPVKELADKLGLEVYQPEMIRDQICFHMLEKISPELIVTASYGQILRKKHLRIPKFGILNVHASLLPELRGAAPIQYAIIRGKTKTGVTIMKTDIGIDTGPVLSFREVLIAENDTAGILEAKLAIIGADLLIETIPKYIAGSLQPVEQDHSAATHAPKISTEDGRIDWNQSAQNICNLIKGMNPCPGAYTTCNKQRLKIHFASLIDRENTENTPGTILEVINGKGITVQTGQEILLIEELQPACKKRMCAESLIRGRSTSIGKILGSIPEGKPLVCPE
ncbi:methionyl-tRNA formyltransferase [bacterium]|nr:methionyl-tRNA formyltransferase [bacterium]